MLLINATPVGMWPAVDASPLPDPGWLSPSGLVLDMVPNPVETRLLREARLRGCRTVPGIVMLVSQALAADAVEAPVVLGAVLLEEEAQVEERFAEQLPVLEQERDEEPPDAAVAVEVGVDCLELRVAEPCPDECRQFAALIVDEALEAGQEFAHRVRRRGDVGRVAGTGAANPVLAASDLSRAFISAGDIFH